MFGEEVVLEEGVVWLKIRDMVEVAMQDIATTNVSVAVLVTSAIFMSPICQVPSLVHHIMCAT